MATQTLATADAILKDLYVGPIVEQLNNKTYMLDQIERDSDSIDHTGRRAVIPVHTNRNRGRGSRGSNSTLPTAGKQTWQDAIANIRYHYYAIEVDDPAIAATRNNEGAFINVLDAETKGVATDMRKDINRQVFGTGDGVLSTLRASSTSTTVNVTSDVQYIQVGDVVDVLKTSDGTVDAKGVVGATVTARDTTAGSETITIDTALAGTATTAFSVYLSGSRNLEMDGLRNIISTSRTLHSINSATAGNEFWNAKSTAVGGVAGESSFTKLLDDVAQNGNGEVDVFITTRGVRRRLADSYQSTKRFNDARAVQVHGGYTAILVNEVPVIADDDAPKGFAFGINKDSFKWFQQEGPGWLQQKDSGIFHLKDGSTAGGKLNVWQAWFKWYSALGCIAPNRNGRLTGCTDDAAV
jgi:hypothetical protein